MQKGVGRGGASMIAKIICEIFNDTHSEKLLLVDCLHNQLKLLNSKSRCLDKFIHQIEKMNGLFQEDFFVVFSF